jgi:DHA1 family bicyclomycin/chloramphenicol resistance-like MFS transporter
VKLFCEVVKNMFTKENKYLFLITVIFIAACIETDIYLPAFPDMMNFFSVSEDKIQSLLTWNFIGMCLSCPFYGPISDAIGRRTPLNFALALFLGGSLITLFASSFDFMLFGRVLQGLGSGGCFTLGTAVIFDAFDEEKAMKVTNKLNTIIPFIMAFAPMLGGYLNYAFGFRSNFLTITLFVLFSFIVCFFWFDETLTTEKKIKLNRKKLLEDFQRVLFSSNFWQINLVISLVFGGYLAFLAGASVLFVIELGVSKEALPFFQASLLGAWLVANLVFNRLLTKWGARSLKKIATCLVLIGGVGIPLAAYLDPSSPYLATQFMMIYSFGSNWLFGLYFPEGMQLFPDIKGVSASLFTSIRLFLVALIIGLSSFLYDKTIYPIAGLIFGLSMIASLCVFLYERRKLANTASLENTQATAASSQN